VPKKKAESALPERSAEAVLPVVECPACKSKISADGSTLKERSKYLADLIETDKSVDELERSIGDLEKALREKGLQLDEAVAQIKTLREGKTDVDKKEKRSGWW
jgi:hypothetical protein